MLNITGLILGKAMALLGGGVLEDMAEEMYLLYLSLLEPFIFLLLFLRVSLNRSRALSSPPASGSLGPRSSQILHVLKDLKHAIIGYIGLCPIGLRFFFFSVSKHGFMVVLLGKIQYYLKLLAKLNVFYIPESF